MTATRDWMIKNFADDPLVYSILSTIEHGAISEDEGAALLLDGLLAERDTLRAECVRLMIESKAVPRRPDFGGPL